MFLSFSFYIMYFFPGWFNKFGLTTINSSYAFRACFLRAVTILQFGWVLKMKHVTWQGIASEEPMAPSELGQALVHGLSKITMLQIFFGNSKKFGVFGLTCWHKIVLFTSPSRVVSVGPGSSRLWQVPGPRHRPFSAWALVEWRGRSQERRTRPITAIHIPFGLVKLVGWFFAVFLWEQFIVPRTCWPWLPRGRRCDCAPWVGVVILVRRSVIMCKSHGRHGTAELLPQLEMVLAPLAHSSFFSGKHPLSWIDLSSEQLYMSFTEISIEVQYHTLTNHGRKGVVLALWMISRTLPRQWGPLRPFWTQIFPNSWFF